MVIKSFVNLKQSFYMTNDQYLEAFTKKLQILNHTRVETRQNKVLCKIIFKESGMYASSAGSIEEAAADKSADDSFQVAAFLCGLNGLCYQSLIDDLSNLFMKNCDEYPQDLVSAYKVATNWKGSIRPNALKLDTGAASAQQDEETKESSDADVNVTTAILCPTDGKPVVCNICQGNHYPMECPNKKTRNRNKNRSSAKKKRRIIRTRPRREILSNPITKLPPW